jgi:hypothetical protein
MQRAKEIKVIKRADRRPAQAPPAQQRVAHAGDSGAGGRDAVTVVNGWVRELRQRKGAEAARGFESLFRDAAAPATQG